MDMYRIKNFKIHVKDAERGDESNAIRIGSIRVIVFEIFAISQISGGNIIVPRFLAM